MKEQIKKQIKDMEKVFENINLTSERGKELLKLAESYFKDSKYFFEKGDLFRALEAISISWAYVDSGLHLGVFSVPEKIKKLFTI